MRPLLLILALLLAGCARAVPTAEQIRAGGPLVRPVVVIGGYGDFGVGDRSLADRLRKQTGDARVLAVHPGLARTFEGAADQVVNAVDDTFVGGSDGETVEVDVVAISMGGVTARYAAAPDARFGDKKRRLKIARLYTVCAPHSGAQMADRWAWADLFFTGKSMRSGGPFLQRLAAREATAGGEERYPIIQYARENDITIGPGSDLPPHLFDRGDVIWLDVGFFQTGHGFCYRDRRVIRDVARRLMSEVEHNAGVAQATQP